MASTIRQTYPNNAIPVNNRITTALYNPRSPIVQDVHKGDYSSASLINVVSRKAAFYDPYSFRSGRSENNDYWRILEIFDLSFERTASDTRLAVCEELTWKRTPTFQNTQNKKGCIAAVRPTRLESDSVTLISYEISENFPLPQNLPCKDFAPKRLLKGKAW